MCLLKHSIRWIHFPQATASRYFKSRNFFIINILIIFIKQKILSSNSKLVPTIRSSWKLHTCVSQLSISNFVCRLSLAGVFGAGPGRSQFKFALEHSNSAESTWCKNPGRSGALTFTDSLMLAQATLPSALIKFISHCCSHDLSCNPVDRNFARILQTRIKSFWRGDICRWTIQIAHHDQSKGQNQCVGELIWVDLVLFS